VGTAIDKRSGRHFEPPDFLSICRAFNVMDPKSQSLGSKLLASVDAGVVGIGERVSGHSGIFGILGLGIVMLYFAWVGYVGTDDHEYVLGALGWLNEFPYLGTDHWSLRHTVVIPVALSLAVFGMREISLGLPSAFFFLLTIALNYFLFATFLGARLSLLVSALVATTPLLIVQATFPQNVIVQVLSISLSFWLFYGGTRCERPGWRMFAAGVAAAFGWLTHESTAALILFYGILFFIGFGVARKYYWIMGLGFVLVVGVEIGYFVAMTGDPFYRYRIDLFHDVVDRFGDAAAAFSSGMTLNLEGNLAVNPVLEPFITLLFNQEFGLLFWAYIPAALWVWRAKNITREHQQLLRCLVGLGLVWMAFVSLNVSVLYVVPRYYAVFTWTAVTVVGYWLAACLARRSARLGFLVGTGMMTVNLLCLYVENKNPLFAERALVQYVSRHQGIVYTDPMTAGRASLLLEFSGYKGRVFGELPPAGGVFYSNPKNIERCRMNGRKCNWPWKEYLPKDRWTVLKRIESTPKLSGTLVRWVGLDPIIPGEILDRLDANFKATFYQATQDQS